MDRQQRPLPPHIKESHERCETFGIDLEAIPEHKYVSAQELKDTLFDYQKLFDVIGFFADQLFQMVDGLPFIFIVTDDNCVILDIQGDPEIKQVMELIGVKPGTKFIESIVGTNTVDLALRLNEPVEVVGTQHFQPFLYGNACYSVPFSFEANGTKRGTISIATFIDFQSPLLLTMLNSVVNSIEREICLRETNARLNILNQIVIESSKNGIIEIDKTGKITEINTQAEEMTGWEKGNLIEGTSSLGAHVKDVLAGEDLTDVEVWITNEKNGKETIAWVDGIPLINENGQISGAFGQIKDVTERYNIKERFNYLAYHDDLTELPNRRSFHQTLKEKLEHLKSEQGNLAIFLLDLDRFKFINDTLGYDKGDFVLVELSKRLKDFLPDHAELFRMGGDEFTIILNDFKDAKEVTAMAEGLIEVFRHSLEIESYEFQMSASIGISIYQKGESEISLIRRADTAMYQAKENGKNHFVMHDADMDHRYFEKLTFEQELKNAMEQNHLELFYQPQVSLCTKEIIGFEALIRWNHPKFGLILPGDIIPLAEELGIATLLGEFVLQKACHQLKEWANRGLPPMKIAINLSPQDFLSHTIVESVQEAITHFQIDASLLEVEITESMAMDVSNAISIMKELNQLGVKIAIDDFGKGFSSLSYLKNFPIKRLKIDRSFVNDILTDQNDAKIISAIIQLAHTLNLEVIAEGVETIEQADYLCSLQCDEAQCYYYGKPMPIGKVQELLLSK
ncbi:EAL domain-containing protein [Ureibacillus chungkukjangi]|uniref:PAS domain S-box-containing protein/diguanylate cyclase (GGDEF)-like protein n=1 Tax=Ureibacillus chungkukjangi TaxID=1202712 RepID=A0A318TE79_9BACL|nr:EAL domain-containing protein [Ureibacillus chungkukjangi]PYF03272.1 PAS domain S-box-containing protein/diguanylate cyclase (GGDEF)-like protein [Ureibacillus chungkukjangi]